LFAVSIGVIHSLGMGIFNFFPTAHTISPERRLNCRIGMMTKNKVRTDGLDNKSKENKMKTTYATLKQDMARAYRDKLKWMTRRVMVPQPPDWAERSYIDGDKNVMVFDGRSRPDGVHFECTLKYGKPGDQLILGTTWSVPKGYDKLTPTELPVGHFAGLPVMTSGYGAAFKPIPIWSYFDGDEKPKGFGELRPAMLLPNKLRDRMPRETLKIVRAEMVQDITEEEAIAEGIDTECEQYHIAQNIMDNLGVVDGASHSIERGSPEISVFKTLWDSIYASKGYSWDSNLWVWCLGW
jgi:hypothetical protein